MTTTNNFEVGQRVKVEKNIDLYPYTILNCAERGTITRLVNEMGIRGVIVKLDREHRGLREWDNEALLTDPEILCIKPIKRVANTLAACLGWGGIGLAAGGLVKAHSAVIGTLLFSGLPGFF